MVHTPCDPVAEFFTFFMWLRVRLILIVVLKTDGFPQTICGDCCSKIMGYRCFKAMCIKSKEILWRKAMEEAIQKGDADTSGILIIQPHLTPNDICSNVVDEDNHELGDNCFKEEPHEDVAHEWNHNGLVCDYAQSSAWSERANLDHAEKAPCINDSMSSASTLIRSNGSENHSDEDSTHLILESSIGDISENDSVQGPQLLNIHPQEAMKRCQAREGNQPIPEIQKKMLNYLEPSDMNEESIGTSYGSKITECSVILTRCDIKKYKESPKSSKSSDETVIAGEETGGKSYRGPPYQCSDCWLSFSSLAFLLKHKTNAHDELGPEAVIEFNVSSNGRFNETSFSSNEKYTNMLNGRSCQTKEISNLVKQKYVINRKSSKEKKIVEWPVLKKSFANSTEKILSSTRQEKVAPLVPCSQLNQSSLEEKLVKSASLREREMGDENSSIGHDVVNGINSNNDKQFENQSKRCKRKFQCDICQKYFSKNTNLRAHINIHRGIRPFICKVCNKSFSTKYNKIRHESTHFEKKSFSCSKCTKCFQSKALLYEHLTHTTYKPYKCGQCGKAFHFSTALRAHKRLHTVKCPFKCNWCPQAFAKKVNLVVHTRVHTGERSYVCV